jgi:hypothetical protein
MCGASIASRLDRSMSNLARSKCHGHRNGIGLVRSNPVSPSWQGEPEVMSTHFGLPYDDATISVDNDLHGMRTPFGQARTLICHAQQHTEMMASRGRGRRACAPRDGKDSTDRKCC